MSITVVKMRLKNQTYTIVLSSEDYYNIRYGDALEVLKRILKKQGYKNVEELVGAYVCCIERFGDGYVLAFIPQLGPSHRGR